jgi:hypothetical protein
MIVNSSIQQNAEEIAVTISDSDPYRRSATKTPDTSDRTIKQKAKEDIQDVKREASTMARDKAEAGQHQIKEGADALSDAIDAAAANLDDHDREGLARYARKLSSDIANAATQLEGRSVDELANDAKQLARKNPALFMLGSIAVGFGLSRFFKASAERDHQDHDARRATPYQDGDLSTGMPTPRPPSETYGTSTAPHGNGRNIQ